MNCVLYLLSFCIMFVSRIDHYYSQKSFRQLFDNCRCRIWMPRFTWGYDDDHTACPLMPHLLGHAHSLLACLNVTSVFISFENIFSLLFPNFLFNCTWYSCFFLFSFLQWIKEIACSSGFHDRKVKIETLLVLDLHILILLCSFTHQLTTKCLEQSSPAH